MHSAFNFEWTLPVQFKHMVCMKEFCSEKIIFDEMTAVRT